MTSRLFALCLVLLFRFGAVQAFTANEIRAVSLPAEARVTLSLIDAGGPFPYPRDGIRFGNYERRLPVQVNDYYREYTVPTPGRSDRGARRIIAGKGGERYYTPDHYRSFFLIRR